MKAVYVVKTFDKETQTSGKVQCIEVPKPQISEPDDVLIKVAYASICGTDSHFIKDNLFSFSAPFPVGHELSGIIEALGPQAEYKGLKVGDHVTGDFILECGHCDNCRLGKRQFCSHPYINQAAQANYILLKADQVFKLPDSIDLLDAALIEPFTVTVGAMDKADLKIGQSVLIIGAGGTGQLLVQLARMSGASLVAVSVRTPHKRALALEMGANYAIDPVNENLDEQVSIITGGRGFDVVIETSGSVKGAEDALRVAAPGGTVVLISYYPSGSMIALDLHKSVVRRDLTIKGMQFAQNSWVRAIKMFPRMNVRPIISKVYALDECEQAYADLISGKYIKLVFDCSK